MNIVILTELSGLVILRVPSCRHVLSLLNIVSVEANSLNWWWYTQGHFVVHSLFVDKNFTEDIVHCLALEHILNRKKRDSNRRHVYGWNIDYNSCVELLS